MAGDFPSFELHEIDRIGRNMGQYVKNLLVESRK
jgi:hypothetical protein